MENWVGEIIKLEKNNTIPVGLQALLHYCDFLQNSHDRSFIFVSSLRKL